VTRCNDCSPSARRSHRGSSSQCSGSASACNAVRCERRGGTACLGLIPARVAGSPIATAAGAAHGWNQLEFEGTHPCCADRPGEYVLLRPQLPHRRRILTVSTCDYGGPFSALVQHGTSAARSSTRSARARRRALLATSWSWLMLLILHRPARRPLRAPAAGPLDAETVFSTEPAAVLDQYVELGASLVHVVDLDGAPTARRKRPAIAALAAGVRTAQVAAESARARRPNAARAGVQRVVVGASRFQPTRSHVAREFGPERS